MNIPSRSSVRTGMACAIAAALLCTLPAAAVFSADDDPVPTRKINYADLNIQSTAGARVLYRRIRTAAIEVCHFGNAWNPSARHAREECVKKAVDDAVRAVPSAELSALHGVARQRNTVVAASR